MYEDCVLYKFYPFLKRHVYESKICLNFHLHLKARFSGCSILLYSQEKGIKAPINSLNINHVPYLKSSNVEMFIFLVIDQ